MLLFCAMAFFAVTSATDWDLLIFTQQYPPTACLAYKEQGGANHVCYLPQPSSSPSWTVHGIWPTKLHTEGPWFCNKSAKFDPDLIRTQIHDLNRIWPNLQGDKSQDSLWKHEWLKHGTCASVLSTLSTEAKYFGKGISWFDNYNMTAILTKYGITPSDEDTYPLYVFNTAIMNEFGKRPRIVCIIEKHSQRPYLLELRVCFDKELNPVDCDGTMLTQGNILTNCPVDSYVFYPLTVPAIGLPTYRVRQSNFRRAVRNILEILTFLNWLV